MTDTQTSAADELRTIIERCSTVYAVVHHVSRSGNQRRIDFYVIERSDGLRTREGRAIGAPEMRRISLLVAEVLGLRLTDDGVVVKASDEPAWDTIYSVRCLLNLYEPDGAGRVGHGFEIRYL